MFSPLSLANDKKYLRLDTKMPHILSDFNQIWIFSKDFRQFSQFQIQTNPSNDSHADMYEHRNRQTH